MFFQFNVRARDQAEPERMAMSSVEIILTRDQYPPTIAFAEYTATITENAPVDGNSVVRIVASDQDLKVNMCDFILEQN